MSRPLVRLENWFKKNYNLISFAFNNETVYSKDKFKWRYPEIMTFSGSEPKGYGDLLDFVYYFRNYEINGAAHFAVKNLYGEIGYVRLSRSYIVTPTKSYIFFNFKDLQKKKFDALHYWFLFNNKHKCAIKVDWRGLKDKLNHAEPNYGDYLKVDLDTISDYVTKYTERDIPHTYKHTINFKSQKHLFTNKIAGSNKRKVILNRAKGKTCEFTSLKQFYKRMAHFKVKFNINSYNSLKSMLSQKKPLVSKNGRYRMFFEKIDSVWVFSAFLTSHKSVSIKTVCTVCENIKKREEKMEAEREKREQRMYDETTKALPLDDFLLLDDSLPLKKYR